MLLMISHGRLVKELSKFNNFSFQNILSQVQVCGLNVIEQLLSHHIIVSNSSQVY